MRHVAPVEELPNRRGHNLYRSLLRKTFGDLLQRDVGHLVDQREDEVRMRVENRSLRLTLLAALTAPVDRFSRAQAPAVAIPMQNRDAACRVDIPPSTAIITRSRKSIL
jgi:hypothetical protein